MMEISSIGNDPYPSLITEAKVCVEKKEFTKAVEICLKIIATDPRHIEASNMLGVCYFQLGNRATALQLLLHVYSFNSSSEQIRSNIAEMMRIATLQVMGQPMSQRIRQLKKSLLYNTENISTWLNLGQMYCEVGKLDHSLLCYEMVLKLNPNHLIGLLLAAKTNAAIYRIDSALRYYQRLLALDPKNSEALVGNGQLHKMLGNDKVAEINLRQAILVNPGSLEAINALSLIYGEEGKVNESIQLFNEFKEKSSVIWQNKLFMLNYKNIPRIELFDEHVKWGIAAEKRLAPLIIKYRHLVSPLSPNTNRPIRLGFVSGDLHEHSVSYFLKSFLLRYDEKLFDVFLYNTKNIEDDQSEEFKKRCKKWVNVHTLDLEQFHQLLLSDKLHILFDLAAHTGNNRIDNFVIRAAPIQISYLGYANTTGTKSIDYRIVDEITDPTDYADSFATEKLLRLPRCFLCYTPPDYLLNSDSIKPQERKINGESRDIILGCFNNISKMSDETLSMWASIMWSCNGNRFAPSHSKRTVTLVLKSTRFNTEEVKLEFIQKLASFGIDINKVRLIKHQETTQKHLQCYQEIDIALDTFPYSGTTTTCEALMMGVPVVTLSGDRHSSNVSASLIKHIGNSSLSKNVCTDVSGYVNRVYELVNNVEMLTEMKGKRLREAFINSQVCDAASYAKNMSDLLASLVPVP